MGSDLNQDAPHEQGNTGQHELVTRRYNRNLLLLSWGLWVVMSIGAAWATFAQDDDDLSLLKFGWAGLALLGALNLLFSASERFVVDEIGIRRRGLPSKTEPTPWAKIRQVRRDPIDQKKGRARFELITWYPNASRQHIDIACTDAQYQQILKWSP